MTLEGTGSALPPLPPTPPTPPSHASPILKVSQIHEPLELTTLAYTLLYINSCWGYQTFDLSARQCTGALFNAIKALK